MSRPLATVESGKCPDGPDDHAASYLASSSLRLLSTLLLLWALLALYNRQSAGTFGLWGFVVTFFGAEPCPPFSSASEWFSSVWRRQAVVNAQLLLRADSR